MKLLALLWSCLSAGFLIACNFISPQAKTSSDFIVSFYTAGLMWLRGQGSKIYPPPGTESWQAAPINDFAHQLFPSLAPELVSNFMYCPCVAFLMSVFAFFPPHIAMTLWQLFNLSLLWISCLLVKKAAGIGSALNFFALALAFAPLIAAIWVGQCSIAFALTPLAFALLFLLRGRNIAAGLFLSILQLKPQFLYFAFSLAFLLPGRKKIMSGLFAGMLLCFILNLSLGAQDLINWVFSLQLSEKFIGQGSFSMPAYLTASLPSAILVQLPVELKSQLRSYIYGLGLVLAGMVLFFYKHACRGSVSAQQTVDAGSSANSGGVQGVKLVDLTKAGFAALLVELLAAPRLLLYDLCLLLPLLLSLASNFENRYSRRLFLAILISVDLYVICCLLANPNPLFLVFGLLLLSFLALKPQS